MLTEAARAYALAQVSAIAGRSIAVTDVDPNSLERWFREWSRTPERERRTRDAWGNWDFSFADAHRQGLSFRPWLDEEIVGTLGAAAAGRWPDGRAFALCLTHDLDFVTREPAPRESLRHLLRDLPAAARAGSAAAGAMARHACLRAAFRLLTLKGVRRPVERGYDEWLALEDRHGFRSTFHVFPEKVTAPHPYDCTYSYSDPASYPGRLSAGAMIRAIDRAGWEIGLHGSYHSAVRPGLLAEQRAQIERLVGRAVTSTRQHWLHYDAELTPRLQSEAGLRVDSTQGFNRSIGFRAGTAFPYGCWDLAGNRPLPLLEVPQHVMDGGLFTANALAYDVDLAVRHCVELMDRVQAVGGCLTLSWHPNHLEIPEYWSTYEQVLEEAARRKAWGCSLRELADWWLERRPAQAPGRERLS